MFMLVLVNLVHQVKLIKMRIVGNGNYLFQLTVPPGFCDSAIAEFIAKSSKLRNFRKSSHIFVIAADFLQILGLRRVSWRHQQHTFSQRKVVSQFEKWNEQPCVLIMPDLQELHWTNGIRATRLGYAAQTVYLLGPEPRAALKHATPLYTALGDTVKKVVEFDAESITSLSNLVRSIHIQRRILLKLRISEQTPLMWKPGKTLFNKHKSPPFTMNLT